MVKREDEGKDDGIGNHGPPHRRRTTLSLHERTSPAKPFLRSFVVASGCAVG